MATSSFDKKIVLTEKGAKALAKALEQKSTSPVHDEVAVKMASKDALSRKVRLY